MLPYTHSPNHLISWYRIAKYLIPNPLFPDKLCVLQGLLQAGVGTWVLSSEECFSRVAQFNIQGLTGRV